MKKLFIFLGLMLILPFVTSAASFVITPASGSYTNGDTIILNISVDPAGSIIYTAMLDAKFSATTLEVVSFTLNDSMLAMKQAGYDSIDNTNGVLVKTGGYTGGVSSLTPFGTLILRTKGSGVGTFTISSDSKLLDSNNTNKQVGSALVNGNYTINAVAAPIPVPVVIPKTTPATQSDGFVGYINGQIQTFPTLEAAQKAGATGIEPNYKRYPTQIKKVATTTQIKEAATTTIEEVISLATTTATTTGTVNPKTNNTVKIIIGVIILALIGYMGYIYKKKKDSQRV